MTPVQRKKNFNYSQLNIVNQAVTISEDVVSDNFNLTISAWKKYRYEIQTLKSLTRREVSPDIFAQILRYSRPGPPDGLRMNHFYRICLQDHNILEAVEREPALNLLPLMIYIITHELVHIVRFYRFLQNFDAPDKEREAEEARVHQLTYNMLKAIKLEELPVILDFYSKYREMIY